MTHSQLTQQDKDAMSEYINGENDALELDIPTSDDYYYLMGWYDTKAKIARGELTNQLKTTNNHSSNTDIDDWEVF